MNKKFIISILWLLSIGIVYYIISNNHTTLIPSQEIIYPVVENQYVKYGPITGSTSIDYQWKKIASIHSGYITYFSGTIKIPSELTWWIYTIAWAHNNVIYLNSDYGSSWLEYNYSWNQMILIYGHVNPERSLKEHCYDNNDDLPGSDKADYIEQNLHTINWIPVYFSYKKFNDKNRSFTEAGGLCTIVNWNELMIWLKNYSKEEIYTILNSFQLTN